MKAGNINGRYIPRLEETSIVWDKWDQFFSLLCVYKSRESDCMVPIYHKENGMNIGKWLCNQRAEMKTGNLDGRCIWRLE